MNMYKREINTYLHSEQVISQGPMLRQEVGSVCIQKTLEFVQLSHRDKVSSKNMVTLNLVELGPLR